jgi:hypothetical protein
LELFKGALESIERGINTRGDNGKGKLDEKNLSNAKECKPWMKWRNWS